MFCSNCGNKINKNEYYCPKCGTKVINNNKKNYDKLIVMIFSIIVLLIICVIIYANVKDFTKLEWDLTTGDANLKFTVDRNLNYKVKALDGDNNPIYDIDFSVNEGEIKVKNNEVMWKLPNKNGKYKIIAKSPSGKKISKTIKYIKVNNSFKTDKLFGLPAKNAEDDDYDKDGLKNDLEEKLKTDLYSADTDFDGLIDYYEVKISKTDPLNKDTDGDSILDGDELALGLNPLKKISKDDEINDKERKLNYEIKDDKNGVIININGKGNIASTTIDVYKNSSFSKDNGFIDKIYNFNTDGKLEKAKVKIKYDLTNCNLNEDDLSIYYFNDKTKKLEKISTEVDKKNKELSATLTHFSKYLIGDTSKVNMNSIVDLLFVLDTSGSMIDNDPSYKRISLSNRIIDMFTGNYRFGVSEFAGNYVSIGKISNDRDKIKNSIKGIKGNSKTSGGTAIVNALEKGLNEFTNNDNNYMLFLTDGKNNVGSLAKSKNNIINSAKSKNVKICIIGLGYNLDSSILNEIAESTGCDYYNAKSEADLNEMYSIIGANINYKYVDTDNDNKTDGMIYKDNGFIVNRDGFSFENFSSNKSLNGHCFGMALFSDLYYQKNLPLSLGFKDNSKFYLSQFKTVELKSNGYNLKDTFIEKKKNLYDFKITNRALKLIFEDLPKDYYDKLSDGVLMIKEEYYDILKNIGATFYNSDYKGDKEVKKIQVALLNIDNDRFNLNVSNEESQILNAIWRLYILQAEAKDTYFSSKPDDSWEKLVNDLSSGKAPVVSITYNGSSHAINAIKLIQDNDDANKFKLQVYDNNYPGENRYITIIRKKYNKFALDYTAWTNDYNYKFYYDPFNEGNDSKINVKLSTIPIE